MAVTIDGETYAYVTNYQMDGAFITDRTHHKVRERDGSTATAVCGASFRVQTHQYADDAAVLTDRYKCKRCFDAAERGDV